MLTVIIKTEFPEESNNYSEVFIDECLYELIFQNVVEQ